METQKDIELVNFVRYDSTGRIHSIGSCTEDELSMQGEALGVNVLANAEAHTVNDYVDLSGSGPVISARLPLMPTYADGVLSGLPAACHLIIEGPVLLDAGIVEAGDHTILFDVPGTYRLRFRWQDPRYLDAELEVEA